MPARILIAHDGTERSTGAGALGQAIAGFTGAQLIVASAFSAWRVGRGHGPAFDRLTPEDAGAALGRARSELGTFPSVEYRAVSGVDAASAILELAAAEDVDLIAVGTSHRAPVAGVAVGSVSEHVLHAASCPVAVVPPGTGRPPLARLAVACDGSSAAAAALAYARSLAEVPGSPVREIDLLVVEDLEPHRRLEVGDPGLFVKGPSPAREWAEREARRPSRDAALRLIRRSGEPAGVLTELSAEYDLLLMGSRNRGPLRRMMLGSVSTSLARGARCPIIVCPRRPSEPGGVDDGRRRFELRVQRELHHARQGTRLGR